LMTFTWLAQGSPELAEQDSGEALARWSQQGFHLQHYNHLLTMAQCALYRGDAPAALARMTETWPLLQRSMLLRIQALRAEIWHARGRALLGSLGSRSDATEAEVLSVSKRLEAEQMPWTIPLAGLLVAGMHHRRKDLDAARSELERAAAGFEAVDMHLYANAARARLGTLLGGTEGAALRAKADRFFLGQSIVDAAAMTRMLAPGFDA